MDAHEHTSACQPAALTTTTGRGVVGREAGEGGAELGARAEEDDEGFGRGEAEDGEQPVLGGHSRSHGHKHDHRSCTSPPTVEAELAKVAAYPVGEGAPRNVTSMFRKSVGDVMDMNKRRKQRGRRVDEMSKFAKKAAQRSG